MKYEKGDIIRTRRFIYWHYGIFISENAVINYSCYPKHWWQNRPQIKILSLNDFVRKSKLQEVYYRSTEKREDIVENAIKCLGETEYSLLNNNCKHFVLSCIPQNNNCKNL